MDSYYTEHGLQRHIGRVEVNGVLLGVRISVTRSYTLSRIALQMYRVGSPDQNIVIGIFDHNFVNNEPGMRIGSWSDQVNNAALPAFPGQKVFFTGLDVPVIPGIYWVVAYPVSGNGDNRENYSGIAGTDGVDYFGDGHLQPGDEHWGEKMFAQVNFWLYSGS